MYADKCARMALILPCQRVPATISGPQRRTKVFIQGGGVCFELACRNMTAPSGTVGYPSVRHSTIPQRARPEQTHGHRRRNRSVAGNRPHVPLDARNERVRLQREETVRAGVRILTGRTTDKTKGAAVQGQESRNGPSRHEWDSISHLTTEFDGRLITLHEPHSQDAVGKKLHSRKSE